jgi:exodeoxyribonuclease V alpha subunit
MLNRNLLYTALTRAKQLAIFFGLERSLGYAVFKDETIKRKTLLKERLVSIE